MAQASKQLMLEEVMDMTTGAACPVVEIRGREYADAIRARNEIEDAIAVGNPRYGCPVCGEALKLRSTGRPEGDPMAVSQFHFWHSRRNGCPLSQKNRWDRKAILAAKYHGQREGQAHIRLKNIIRDSLDSDSRFAKVEVEKTWRLDGDPTRWRRPDVSAEFLGRPVVFEIQLSTTFVDVMAERRNFYRERGALLIWIVAEYDHEWAKITHHDIFYPNNRNIFVANQETLDSSIIGAAMCLQANWQEPVIEGEEVRFLPRKELVKFSELTLDYEGQRAYYFDCEKAEERQRKLLSTQPLRDMFERHWFFDWDADNSISMTREKSRDWMKVRAAFSAEGIEIPGDRSDLHPLINSMYSVRDFQPGRLVGWRYDNLVKLAHHLYDQHKSVLWPFCLAIAVYGRKSVIENDDKKNRWRDKKGELIDGFLDGKFGADMPENMRRILKVLFPEMIEILDMQPEEIVRRRN